MKRYNNKPLSYSEYWMKKGQYGENRIASMLRRKLERHYKRSNRYRKGSNMKKIDGQWYQICDYQPIGSCGTSWCKYPCEGDC